MDFLAAATGFFSFVLTGAGLFGLWLAFFGFTVRALLDFLHSVSLFYLFFYGCRTIWAFFPGIIYCLHFQKRAIFPRLLSGTCHLVKSLYIVSLNGVYNCTLPTQIVNTFSVSLLFLLGFWFWCSFFGTNWFLWLHFTSTGFPGSILNLALLNVEAHSRNLKF